MSHSTTKTSSYVLSKYSRAYPGKGSFQKPMHPSSAAAPEQAVQEWQHYTNPVIRVLLNTKISKNKDIESVRLRILWQINFGDDAESGQQDVVFEDMDLLSFSSIAAPIPRKHQTEGLPLKAVYRDTTVGIRYFYSRDLDGITPVYRRFQISFQSLSEASNFIELIKPICPCRLNPSAGASFTVPQSQVASNVRGTSVLHKHTTSDPAVSYRGSQLVNLSEPGTAGSVIPSVERAVAPPHRQLSLMQARACLSSPLRQEPLSGNVSCIALNCNNSSPFHRPSSVAPALPFDSQNTIPEKESAPVHEHMSFAFRQLNAPFSSPLTIASSGPAVAEKSAASVPSSTPPSVYNQQEITQSVLAGLDRAVSIYNLSDTALEQTIGEILQEDKFLQLVERISEMTSIRRLADV